MEDKKAATETEVDASANWRARLKPLDEFAYKPRPQPKGMEPIPHLSKLVIAMPKAAVDASADDVANTDVEMDVAEGEKPGTANGEEGGGASGDDAFAAAVVAKVDVAVTQFCEKKVGAMKQMKFRKTLDSEMRGVILAELTAAGRTADTELGKRIFAECARLYDDNRLGETPSRAVTGRNTRLHDCAEEDIRARMERVNEVDATLPEQRTPGWYAARRKLLSASDIWKALGTPAQKNSLIYAKCAPDNPEKYSRVNMNSSLHWGQKYEPVSQQYYEYTRGCRVREYGCIPHKEHDFLGASPDDIVVESERHPELVGRMLEIKNVISREITGVPKLEYWVQMQMQMECCDLEECDFLECKFEEYHSYNEFKGDTDGSGNMHRTHDGHWKGMFLCLTDPDGKPHYEYPDFGLDTLEAMDGWCDAKVAEMEERGYSWLKYVYWRMPRVSCVLVPRNRRWFAAALPQFRSLWETILAERESGYEHRAPKRRVAAPAGGGGGGPTASGITPTASGIAKKKTGGGRRMRQTTLNVVKIDMHAVDTFQGDTGEEESDGKPAPAK